MMRRLIDHSAIIVRMPASSPSILPFVCRMPVIAPAIMPAHRPRASQAAGSGRAWMHGGGRRGARRQAAVNREVGEVEHPKGEIHPESKNSVEKPNFNCANCSNHAPPPGVSSVVLSVPAPRPTALARCHQSCAAAAPATSMTASFSCGAPMEIRSPSPGKQRTDTPRAAKTSVRASLASPPPGSTQTLPASR